MQELSASGLGTELRRIDVRISTHFQHAADELLGVGLCLIEAKERELVPHGQWEEWVRQHFIQYLTGQLNVPSSLVAVEVPMQVNRLKKRGDIVVYGRNGKPCLIVECKAPEVNVTQAVFDQVAIYNMALLVPYLVVTNGLVHFACRINHSDRSIEFLKELPDYQQMSKP